MVSEPQGCTSDAVPTHIAEKAPLVLDISPSDRPDGSVPS